MSLETGVVLDQQGDPLYWHTPSGRTVASLPDSQDLWEIFWNHRRLVSGFAHSHPSGMAVPSHTDLTTFSAVELGLGRKLDWWIVTPELLTLTRWVGRKRLHYKTIEVAQRPEWFYGLLRYSNYNQM